MNTSTNAKPIELNPTQAAVLNHAIDHTKGKIEWFPANIKGGARQKVIEALFKRAMIIGSDGDWQVASEAYDALGRPRPGKRRQGDASWRQGPQSRTQGRDCAAGRCRSG